jgi:hypothetical protein
LAQRVVREGKRPFALPQSLLLDTSMQCTNEKTA